MGPVGPGFELRMELAGHKPGMVRQLDHFNDMLVRRYTGEQHSLLLHLFPVIVIEFISVAVALVNELLAVFAICLGADIQNTGILPQPHGAAPLVHIPLVRHQIDDVVGRRRVDFGRMRIRIPQHVAGKFHHRDLHTQANAQVRDPVFTGVAGGGDLAVDAAAAETSRAL